MDLAGNQKNEYTKHMVTTAHNHKNCISNAITGAQLRCGAALTPLRRQVLEALWHSHEAKGAYDLLNEINSSSKKKLAPLSVYRALDYLVMQGLAHRIECINAYVGCPHPDEQHALQFLICRDCHSVTELADSSIAKSLSASAKKHKFSNVRAMVEVLGLCANCQAK